MRPLPTFLALAAFAVPLAAPVDAAPPKKTCHLLRAGERELDPVSPRPIVIKSADVASDDRDLTAVIRVENIEDPQHTGMTKAYEFAFSVSEKESYRLVAWLRPLVEPEGWLRRASQPMDPGKYNMTSAEHLTAARVVVDRARGEVRLSVSTEVFRALRTGVRPGVRVTYLAAITYTGILLPTNQAVPDPPLGAFTNGDWVYGRRKVT